MNSHLRWWFVPSLHSFHRPYGSVAAFLYPAGRDRRFGGMGGTCCPSTQAAALTMRQKQFGAFYGGLQGNGGSMSTWIHHILTRTRTKWSSPPAKAVGASPSWTNGAQFWWNSCYCGIQLTQPPKRSVRSTNSATKVRKRSELEQKGRIIEIYYFIPRGPAARRPSPPCLK